MPIKQNIKRNLAEPGTKNDGAVKKAGLFVVNENGTIEKKTFYGTFLLNPASFEDSKSSNWVQTSIPGQSDPVFQWISSGARTITFDALITKDKSNLSASDESADNVVATNAASTEAFFARVAGLIAGVKAENIKASTLSIAEDLSIEDHLNYYRSLLYPKYEEEGRRRLKESPPRLILLAGNSITSKPYSDKIDNKSVTWVLTELRIKTTKMLPNLAPMEAIVSFTLVQYNQESTSSNDVFTSSRPLPKTEIG